MIEKINLKINKNLSRYAMDFLENSKNDAYDMFNAASSLSLWEIMKAGEASQPQLDNCINIPLSPLEDAETDQLYQLNKNRKSTREYNENGISFNTLSQLLGKSYFITSKNPTRFNIPSGGGLFPIDLYLLNLNVNDLDKGIYYYNPYKKSLQLFLALNDQETLSFVDKAFMPNSRDDIKFSTASAVIIFGAMCSRSTIKYRDKGLRFAFMDTGLILQNLYLNATTLGIGICGNGGYMEDYLRDILEFTNPTENVLLTAVIG